ncbi:dethiobiotin synthase [bacterium SCSIO 12741]|nr:dethiobiotin synthase [bacterium SCSIO 12741]
MKHTFFVSGIGTEIGKTVSSAILTEALKADYWKPIQAGELDYSDSHKIEEWVSHPQLHIHPERHRLEHPMSPHAAAARENVQIEIKDFKTPEPVNSTLLIEGAGGLLVPLNDTITLLDLIQELQVPVILISRYYLGSINHTLLSAEVLKNRGIEVAGIVFNGEENAESKSVILDMTGLKELGCIPELEEVTPETIKQAADQLRPQLLKSLFNE